MALKGNLRDFSITQILNLINLARKTGSLVVEGPSESAQMTFREGKLAFSQYAQEDNSLAGILFRSRRITSGQFQILKERAGQMNDKELGLLLINSGYLTQEAILGSLQGYFADSVRRLFTWLEGNFRFEPGLLAPEGKIMVRIDLENLIIEGSRQLREWEHLQEEIPSLEMALKFTDRPGANIRSMNLSVEEWRVVSFVNPQNAIQQIARAAKMNDLEVRRVIYGLLQAGLVELVRPGGMPVLKAGQSFPTQNKAEQVSLVHRLINRIRSL